MNPANLKKRNSILRVLGLGIIITSFFSVCTGKKLDSSMRQDSLSVNEAQSGSDSIIDLKKERPSIQIGAVDSLGLNPEDRYSHLTDEDFKLVADELGIEVAVIKAVVVIEAGAAMKGFSAPGVPVVNFDPTMYAKYKNKATSTAGDKSAKVPEGLKGHALKEWTQLTNARKVNKEGADMGTFWGMFQIGGFNYKRCGCESVNEFVERMSYSELEQLQLFAIFIENSDMLKYLKKKDWSGFARRYNGKSYAKRGYHTKMAKAYAKFSK